jgi:hypothetical protein
MSIVHNCPACYTDMEHNKLMRCIPPDNLWRVEWAVRLPEDVNQEILKSFAFSTISTYFITKWQTKDLIKTMNILLNNPVFDPTFSENALIRYAIGYFNTSSYEYDRVYLKLRVFENPMIACIWAHPAVRASYKPPSKSEYEIEVDDVTTHWTGKKSRLSIDDEISRIWKSCVVKQCKAVKGELMERTWHPDRVWNWCFDEEEKREIGSD